MAIPPAQVSPVLKLLALLEEIIAERLAGAEGIVSMDELLEVRHWLMEILEDEGR
ncbi:hypothetical protein [Amaricoccus solimangrovi]|uniref:hypothetical protein n=1 Tax=Amaricoccus solimangrovi TaxID=2589815 RepID=UPI0015E3B9E2|nr:hypothetical protein [Amaricoccus solimangrovi]